MKRRGFICILGRIASGFWSRRGIVIVVAAAMILMPIKVSHAGWLSDLFKGSSKQGKSPRHSRPPKQAAALKPAAVTKHAALSKRHTVKLAALGPVHLSPAALKPAANRCDPAKFRIVTRWGDLDKVLAGIEAAQSAGLAVKINTVALKNFNEDEIPALIDWAHGKGMALTLIEVMPMGEIGDGRIDQYLPLSLLRTRLAKHYTMTDLSEDTGGPARFVRIAETGGKLGFITPMTHNFCESCNRVRVTCTGTLHTCLGQEDASDLRKPLRASPNDELLSAAIDRAIGLKPKGHDFIIDRRHNRPSVSRHMSVTGG